MSDYYELVNRFEPDTTVRSAEVNDAFDGVAAGFDMLPTEAEIKHGKINIGVDSGTADAYVITNPTPYTGPLAANDQIRFRALFANLTTSPVLNPDGQGNLAVIRENGDACQPGDIVAEGLTIVTFDGVKLRVAGASAADLAATTLQAQAAAVSAAAALNAQNNAAAAQAAAAASAVAAAASAASLYGTSATSTLIATGAKTFTTESGKSWPVGSFMVVASRANVANFMFGQVTSYSGTTLILSVSQIGGAGTFTDWNVDLSGVTGPTGPAGPAGSGSGDVTGPGVAVSGRVVTFSGTTGKIIQDSGVTLGSIASQAASSVTITGGSVIGITDLAVADGGSGSSTAAGARTNFGVVIGTDVQAFNAKLTAIGSGATWAANKFPLFTSASAVAMNDMSADAQTFNAAANFAAMRTALGVAASAPAIEGAARGLVGHSSATGDQVFFAATELVLKNSSGDAVLVTLVTDTTAVPAVGVGVSSIDAGVTANATWYYAWAIRKTAPVTALAVTASAATDRISESGGGRLANEPVIFGGTAVPTGLVAGTVYYVRDVSGTTYKLCAIPGGAAIDLTSAGTAVTVSDVPGILYSLSATAPTLPASYTYKALIGRLRGASATTIRPFYQKGKKVSAPSVVAMQSTAVSSAGAFQSLDISAICPPDAIGCFGVAGANTGAANAYAITLSGKLGSFGAVEVVGGTVTATASYLGLIKGAMFAIDLDSGSALYWTANLTGAFNCIIITGFELP